MEIKQESAAVHYALDKVLTVNKSQISLLIEQVKNTPQGRIRLCTHVSPDSLVHEMLIVLTKNSDIRPHKHLKKTESFHIIQGACSVVLFNDDGTVRQIISLGDYQSGKNFYYRLLEPLFHTVVVESDLVIFHETTEGPFHPDETIYADWP